MAEVTALRSNALNYPVYGSPYGVTFPILDADGDLVTGAAGLDSELSQNGNTFTDCTNEATEIATSSGMYYLLLTATELTTDVATIIVKTSTTGAKTTPLVLYPRKLVTLRSGTAAGGTSSTITLDGSASPINDLYNGCLCVGTLDSNVEARVITDYDGSTQVATVVPDWVTTPDNNDTFIIYIPEGMQVPQADVRGWLGTAPSTPTVAGVPNVNTKTWNDLATVALPLVPTTAGRTLDVSTGGEAGLDWANIGSPTTTVGLSGTTIKAVTDAVSANVASINSISTSSVTTVSANQGTTQPVNFTGTAGSALVKSDTVDIAGAAVSTSTAQVGVNVVSYASGQAPLQPTVAARTLDVSATGEAGVDWANIGSPTTTVNLSGTTIKAVTDAVTISSLAIQAIWDALTSALTTAGSIGKLLVDNVNATISSRLAPTTAGRTLDVTTTGEAGIDWSNIGAPTTSVALTGTTISSSQVVASVSGAVGSVTSPVTVGTNNDKTGYALSTAGVDLIWDDAVDGAVTARESLRLANSANGAITAGGATTTFTIRDLADTKDRVTATVDANGNRSAVTRDLT